MTPFFEEFWRMYEKHENMRNNIRNAGLFIFEIILNYNENATFERGLINYVCAQTKDVINPILIKFGGFQAIKLLSMWDEEDKAVFQENWSLAVKIEMILIACVGRIIYTLKTQRTLPDSIVQFFNLKNAGSQDSFSLNEIIDYNTKKVAGHYGCFNLLIYFANHMRGISLNAFALGILWVNMIEFGFCFFFLVFAFFFIFLLFVWFLLGYFLGFFFIFCAFGIWVIFCFVLCMSVVQIRLAL